jgi:hypothetical protein
VRIRITRLAGALVSTSVLLTAAVVCAGSAGADPQEDQFVALLAQQQIPATDNVPGLVYRAHQICGELDGGASVQATIDEEVNTAFGDNPMLRQVPNRVNRTATRFIIASVTVYCPSHIGQLPPSS